MIISASLRSSSDASEAPPIQLPCKARELGMLEIKRHYLGSELSLLQDYKSLPMRKPSDDVGNLSIGKNLHELHVKNENIRDVKRRVQQGVRMLRRWSKRLAKGSNEKGALYRELAKKLTFWGKVMGTSLSSIDGVFLASEAASSAALRTFVGDEAVSAPPAGGVSVPRLASADAAVKTELWRFLVGSASMARLIRPFKVLSRLVGSTPLEVSVSMDSSSRSCLESSIMVVWFSGTRYIQYLLEY